MSRANGNLLVVGSVAFDDLEFQNLYPVHNVLGGAATHFAIAASPFVDRTRLVGVVGDDFQQHDRQILNRHRVDLLGLEQRPGNTFRWGGTYHEDMNHRDTRYTHLGVFENFQPQLPQGWEQTPFVFLANIHPRLQHDVLDQMQHVQFVAMDTMNLWINTQRNVLARLLERVNGIIISDQEAALLTGERLILKMGRAVQQLGPKTVVIKRGEHGAFLFHGPELFYVPAHPLKEVIDPTGAGDSFAGGFMGMLACHGEVTMDTLRRAMIAGSVMASFCVQNYGVFGTTGKSLDHVEERYKTFVQLTRCPEFVPLT